MKYKMKSPLNISLSKIRQNPIALVVIFLVIAATLGLLIGSFLSSGRKGEEAREARAIKVEAEEVRIGAITKKITTPAILTANQEVKVRPQVSGVVSEILVEGGKEIEAGTTILKIDDRAFRAKLKEEQAKLAFAKANFERYKKLAEQKFFGALKKFEEAEAEFKKAEAEAEIAQKKVDDSEIKAPFEGIVTINNLSKGSPVSETQDIFQIVDMDPIKVDFHIPAEYLRAISVDQELEVIIDGFEDKPFKAKIESIDARVDPKAHTILVRAVISNEKRLLKPGLFARITLIVGSSDQALIVPSIALQGTEEDRFVFVAQPKEFEGRMRFIAQKVKIVTGFKEKDNVEILRGLKEGELVVTVGMHRIPPQGYFVTFDGMNKYLSPETHKADKNQVDTSKKKESQTGQ